MLLLSFGALLVSPNAPLFAQDPSTEEAAPSAPSAGAEATAEEILTPPIPLTPIEVAYPKDAPPQVDSLVVEVKLTIGVDGRVSRVTLVSKPQSPFDEAVKRGASLFRFTPATYGGQPIAVEVPFSQTFIPPPPPPVVEEAGISLDAELRGQLREKGTRAWVVGASVVALVGEDTFVTQSDDRGRFNLKLPHGDLTVSVLSSAHLPFKQRERLKEGEALTVGYLIQRVRYNDDDVVIFGKRKRTEVSRTTLRGREIQQVPGTFGDPFRVVQTLPGVTTPISILPLPVVRGSSPSSTGYLLDKVRIPLLFHLLGGPSVIQPAFIDEIHFYPGGFPVHYGGYTGGIIDGETRRARQDERLVDIDFNLLQAGAMVRTPIPKTNLRLSAAGRYGYPGALISLLSDEFSLSYWDYQFRLDGGRPNHGWTLFSFGARDLISTLSEESGVLEPSLRYEFHRVDLRYHITRGAMRLKSQVALGVDETQFGADTAQILLTQISPRVDVDYALNDTFNLRMGADGSYRISDLEEPATEGPEEGMGRASALTDEDDLSQPGDIITAGLYTEALWRPNTRWLIRPGVRIDHLQDDTADQLTLDPRLTLRYQLFGPDDEADERAQEVSEDSLDVPLSSDSDRRSLWLKAGIGRYHQPPRFLVPIPGLDQLALEYGMLSSTQYTLGAELSLSRTFSLDTQAYYNDMDPVIFDININPSSLQTAPSFEPGTAPEENDDELLDRLIAPQVGRAFGLEVLLRRRSQHGVYGWLSYTLSRSERRREGAWVAFDYDRTHIMNAVIGVPLGNQWEIGARFQYQSGAPTTTTYGYNEGRKSGYVRLDLRIDKRAVWNDWMLDYYIDIQNALLSPEEVSPGSFFRFVLPTIGLRAKL